MSRPPNEPFDERDLYAHNPDPFSAFTKDTNEPRPSGPTRPIGSYEVPEPVIPVASGGGVALALALTLLALLLGVAIFLLAT